ncbi:mRNA,: RTFL01-09-C22 [Quillaja saponaria]|uniref:mRNA,: RTFL01-09-C22 n=1 Tax=Quillaja saponaria TaxID=32244 RepID=A0AAD7L9X6_QUISA|nr:mRNA,: RTFL01-09-C22 [Quillaja saponaria]
MFVAPQRKRTSFGQINRVMEQKQSMMMKDEDGDVGVPIHSQVIKIKQEIEKIKHPSLKQSEMRRVLLRDINRQPSRSLSPLGLPEKRAISVGN